MNQVANFSVSTSVAICALCFSIKECGEVGNMLYSMFSHIHEPDGDTRIKIYDPTAVGIMLHPEFFTLKPANVEIELAGRYTYGGSNVPCLQFLTVQHKRANLNEKQSAPLLDLQQYCILQTGYDFHDQYFHP